MRRLLFLPLILASPVALAVEPTPSEIRAASSWFDRNLHADASTVPGLSFVYGGKNSRELLRVWDASEETSETPAGGLIRSMSWTDPKSGLVVRCVARLEKSLPTVDWRTTFENRGTEPTPILESIRTLDARFGRSKGARLFHASGSHALLGDFEPKETVVGTNGKVELKPFQGRSSDGSLPFFNLAWEEGGVVVSLGWTGQWTATFEGVASGTVEAKAGLEDLHASLRPGESIQAPSIRLVFWDGPDRMRGQNLQRRVLLECDTPPEARRPLIAASPHAVIGFEKTTEANMLDLIRKVGAHNLAFDYWWIDAGWYTCNDNWARYVGNPDPDPIRFPAGLRPISDAARASGMKFLLWFEPERVMPDTWLDREHHDWLLTPPEGLPEEIAYQKNDGFRLLDLGNREARTWATGKLTAQVRDFQVDCYRNDFNLYPLPYWRASEPKDRRGTREAAYIAGLYELFDALKASRPGLVIDTCASGGRRIDLEMLRRALVLTRSDYLWDPIGQQCHTFGLAQWIPITGIGAASVDAYSTRSGLGSHFTLAANYGSESPQEWEGIRRTVAEFHRYQDLFTGDFMPLSEYTTSSEAWMAWRFDRPDLGRGLVQAFRRPGSQSTSQRYRLPGLDPDARYRFMDVDRNVATIKSGREVEESGVEIQIDSRPGSAVIEYERLKAE